MSDVNGLTILDAGCGGGQNAVRFAQMGATVIATDISLRQLDHARNAAQAAGVELQLVCSDLATLKSVSSNSVDLVFCANALPYIEKVGPVLQSFRRALLPAGRLIASMDHPLRACFHDAETSELTNYPEQDYFSAEPRHWLYDGAVVQMTSYERTIGDWTDALRHAGFLLQRIVEPQAPAHILDDFFPEDGALASLRNIPHTLILIAQLTDTQVNTSTEQ